MGPCVSHLILDGNVAGKAKADFVGKEAAEEEKREPEGPAEGPGSVLVDGRDTPSLAIRPFRDALAKIGATADQR